LENVVFEHCKLDYATLTNVSARGPVILRECSLSSATLTGCDLSHSALEGCSLTGTEFAHGTYRGMDLRGNDLSALSRVGNLKNIIIDHGQSYELAAALAADLEVTFGDDLEEDHPHAAARGRRR
jgi:uncharacterized protein YjbI with pentapeptide repeats